MSRPAIPVRMPSRSALIGMTILALTASLLIVFTIILPASFRLDPTGAGRRFGLMRSQPDPGPAPLMTAFVHTYAAAFRTDEFDLAILPFGDLAFQVDMDQDAALLYSWKSSGPVDVDFHSESEQDPDRTASHHATSGTAGDGSLIAPFSGSHGWYWLNHGQQRVNIHLKLAGFYRLKKPVEE